MFPCRRYIPVGGTNLLPIGQARLASRLIPWGTLLYGNWGTKQVLEYGVSLWDSLMFGRVLEY